MGIGILAYMPLAGGLLSGKAHLTPAGSRTREVEEEYGIVLDENRQLAEFSEYCQEIGEPGHVVAIAWTLANPAVTSAIVGVRTRQHLNGLARAAELELDESSMQRLNEIFDINKGRRLRPGQAPEAYAW
jgi:aryl-alcohol dehydrogenase-like predicted oxidoreductase